MRDGTSAHARGLTTALTALAMVLVSALGLAGLGQAATSDGSPRNDPETQRQVAEGEARAKAWEAAHPEPSTQEVEASRVAFLDLSAADALALAKKEFPRWLTSPVLVGGLPLSRGQRVERFVSEHEATITAPNGRRATVRSTLPMLGESPDGAQEPIDLRLQSVAGGFAPRSSADQVVIPSSASGKIRFKDRDFALRLGGAEDQAGELTQDRVFYANVYGRSRHTDAVVEARHTGVEVSYQIRGGSEDQAIDFDLPAGGRLQLHGGRRGQQHVSIERADGSVVGQVMPSWAIDATGRHVPTSYSLEGQDRLVMHVAYKDGNYKLPVLADPFVAGWNPGMFNAWSWGASSGNMSPWTANSFTGTRGPSIVGQGSIGEFARWTYPSISGAYIYQMYASNTWHYANVSQEFGGLWDPTGSSTPGTWQDTISSGGSGPGGSGWPASRYQSGMESYVNTVYCGEWGNAANCQPPPHFQAGANHANNHAEIGGVRMLGAIGSGWIPQGSTYGAYLYESDDVVPTLNNPTHSGLPTGWVRSFSATAGLTGSVTTGLGMYSLRISGPGFSRASFASCSSFPCPFSQSTSLSYGSSDIGSDGVSTISAVATNQGGNQSSPKTWTVKLDRAAPNATESGEGWTTGTYTPNSVHTFNVSSTDPLSGVDRVVIDDIGADGNAVSNHRQIMRRNPTNGSTTCTGYECPAANPNRVCNPTTENGCELNTSYTARVDSTWAPGKHT